MPEFSLVEKDSREILLSYCRENIGGTEVYSAIKASDDRDIWKGIDGNGRIISLVFDNGDEYIKVFGEEFPPFFSFSEKCLMVYEGTEEIRKDPRVKSLSGKELLLFYRLLGEGKMTFDDEKRYVTRLRYVNKGLSAVFGIYSENELVSVAAIGAVNEKYALVCDVFTKREFRRKGLAALCLGECISFALERGLIPYLRCEEDMCSYYEKSGFVYYGNL